MITRRSTGIARRQVEQNEITFQPARCMSPTVRAFLHQADVGQRSGLGPPMTCLSSPVLEAREQTQNFGCLRRAVGHPCGSARPRRPDARLAKIQETLRNG
jgi:hypothetical protein